MVVGILYMYDNIHVLNIRMPPVRTMVVQTPAYPGRYCMVHPMDPRIQECSLAEVLGPFLHSLIVVPN